MNGQKRQRTNYKNSWLKRGEWNALLLAAIWSLLAASPSVGASFAASSLATSPLVPSLSTASAPDQYQAMLWWLHRSASGVSGRALAAPFTAAAHSSVAHAPLVLETVTPAADSQQVAAWLVTLEEAALQDKLPVLHTTEIALPEPHTVAASDTQYIQKFSVARTSVARLPFTAQPSQRTALRYDATRRFAVRSLSHHEASQRSGTRTQRFLE